MRAHTEAGICKRYTGRKVLAKRRSKISSGGIVTNVNSQKEMSLHTYPRLESNQDPLKDVVLSHACLPIPSHGLLLSSYSEMAVSLSE
jgi:hypothetical protein